MIGEISRKGVGILYIPEFVCGIGVTIIAEMVFLIAYTVYATINNRKK